MKEFNIFYFFQTVVVSLFKWIYIFCSEKQKIMNEDTKKSLKYLLWNGASASAGDTISSGTIIIALATLLGAGNFYIGLIVSLPYFSNLMNFFVGFLLEKGYSCKKISVISSLISKPMYFIIALLPFFCDKENILPCLFMCIFFLYFSGNITGGAFSVWVKRLVPEKILGVFFAKRYSYMMISKLLCYTGVYFLLKYIKQLSNDVQIYAYSVMFFVAFCIGIFTITTFVLMKETHVDFKRSEFISNLKLGFKNKNFQNVVLFLSVFNFLTYFFFPFVTVFMLKGLNYSMDVVIIITIIFQLAYIFSSNIWGKLNDENPQTPVKISLLLLAICAVCFMILGLNHAVNAAVLFAEISLLHIVLGIINCSFQLSSNNIPLICIPDVKANTLIPTTNAIRSFFACLGSVFAGVFISYCAKCEQKLNFPNHDGWFMFFLFALILSLYLVFNVKKLKKYDNTLS